MTAKVPTALKIVTGNPGKRALPANEPKPPPADTLKAPPYLDAVAKKEWRRVVQVLADLGLYTEVDLTPLAGYCEAFSDWLRYGKQLRELRSKQPNDLAETPNGLQQQHALVSLRNAARKDMTRLCAEFGMTPKARTGMDVSFTRKPPAAPPGDPAAARAAGYFGT